MSLGQSVPEEKQSSAFSRIEERRELGQLVPCVTVSLVSKWDKGADRGWTYAQSRWTSARQIGQVRLACKEPRGEKKISRMLLLLVRF